MQKGDFAKYRNTGTIGKVLDVKEDNGATWILLDTTDLYYDMSTIEPATEKEYSEATNMREKTVDDQIQEVERLRDSIKEVEETVRRITPSGAG